jgi:hypothetical protein
MKFEAVDVALHRKSAVTQVVMCTRGDWAWRHNKDDSKLHCLLPGFNKWEVIKFVGASSFNSSLGHSDRRLPDLGPPDVYLEM